jgi:ligand-binding SRPBCC domain-containing protein
VHPSVENLPRISDIVHWWTQWLSCGLAAGTMLFLVGAAFHVIAPVLFPSIPPQYLNPEVFRPLCGWTLIYLLLHPFGYGFIFAAIFLALRWRSSFPPGVRGGLIYGTGVFVVGSLPVYLLNVASFQVSAEIIASWIVQSLTQYAIAGMVIGAVADGVMVRVSSELPASAERVWELLLRKDTFLNITRGMMSYSDTDRWPETLFSPGTTLATRIRLFQWGPATRHEVRIVRVDEAEREIDTEESGPRVRAWNHRMRVEAISANESRYTDRVELRAGLLTPVVWLFALLFYRYRHRRWKSLIAEVGL